jgi:hypothetical protein
MTVALLAALLVGSRPDTLLTHRITATGMAIEFAPVDSAVATKLVGTLRAGRSAVEAFFGGRYPVAFTVRIYPSRTALTAHWARAWGLPDLKAECWMVASGVGDELALVAGRAPARLADAWSGRWRYGVSGSLVGYVDSLRGRRAVVAILADTSQASLLGHLDLTEDQLLAGWRVAAAR